ncbi:MAG: hypothetical protein IT423_09565, partial [Pirellulaceae bacterium]|nr:hypothetical protein [Pirellulaceae bacterium]
NDGIFDVLDVPLELLGTGYYDTVADAYKFRGSANVATLPNRNPDGLRNDITINRVSHIQFRVDGGPWSNAISPNQYTVDLDLSLPIAQPGQVIEIRAIDSRTGLTSNVFQGQFDRSDAVTYPGVNGFVWFDTNKNGLRDVEEFGEAGWTVELLSATGQSLNIRRTVEPDSLPDGALTASSVAGIHITTIGNDSDGRAGIFADSVTSTGTKTFRAYSRSTQSWSSTWNAETRRMKVDFVAPTSVVEIDAIGTGADTYGRLEAYDSNGNLVDRFTTDKLSAGQISKMRTESVAGNIAYVIIGGHANSTVRLDHLRFGAETVTTTTARGQYSIPLVPADTYLVKVTAPAGFSPLTSGGDRLPASVVGTNATTGVDFGFNSETSPWQNPLNRFDVNNVDGVTALDVLLVINEINQNGPRSLVGSSLLAPPYIDVNGDGFVTALDALQVINVINAGGSGEAHDLALWALSEDLKLRARR